MPYFEMFSQPGKIFVCACRVHDEQVLLLVDPINNEVINDPATIVEQKCVLTHANVEPVDIVGQHAIEPIARIGGLDDELAHVRNVEDADIVPDCLMFLDDTGVLNGHYPAGEWNHFRSESHVLIVKGGF